MALQFTSACGDFGVDASKNLYHLKPSPTLVGRLKKSPFWMGDSHGLSLLTDTFGDTFILTPSGIRFVFGILGKPVAVAASASTGPEDGMAVINVLDGYGRVWTCGSDGILRNIAMTGVDGLELTVREKYLAVRGAESLWIGKTGRGRDFDKGKTVRCDEVVEYGECCVTVRVGDETREIDLDGEQV